MGLKLRENGFYKKNLKGKSKEVLKTFLTTNTPTVSRDGSLPGAQWCTHLINCYAMELNGGGGPVHWRQAKPGTGWSTCCHENNFHTRDAGTGQHVLSLLIKSHFSLLSLGVLQGLQQRESSLLPNVSFTVSVFHLWLYFLKRSLPLGLR